MLRRPILLLVERMLGARSLANRPPRAFPRLPAVQGVAVLAGSSFDDHEPGTIRVPPRQSTTAESLFFHSGDRYWSGLAGSVPTR